MQNPAVRIFLMVLALSALTFAILLLRSVGPGGDGTLAELKLSDGQRFEVFQEWNGWKSWSEPYSVSMHSQEPGGRWVWHYVSHEDWRWYDGRLLHNTTEGTVELYRGKTLRGRFVLAEREWELVR